VRHAIAVALHLDVIVDEVKLSQSTFASVYIINCATNELAKVA
jgi:hypothetical protein